MRNITKSMKIGGLTIGNGAPITIQSMLNLPWHDTEGNLAQAKQLEDAGCDILRVAVPTHESIQLFAKLKEILTIPLVADIHFDWKLALEAVAAGADKIRINPGNIGSADRVKAVARACDAANIPIRIGVNSGSLEKSILEKHTSASAEALVESALYHASLLNQFEFDNIALSVKASDVPTMLRSYRLLSQKTNYPLHLGVTHTGTHRMGIIKSSMGIGALLTEGIGDTLRVSLSALPIEEIRLAKDILRAAGITKGLNIISCPTCGRASADVISLTQKVERALENYSEEPLTIAVMGCVVNGPGEAREADFGITAGSGGKYALFAKGKIIATLPEEQILARLLQEIESKIDNN